jgi:hypothetical protein
MRDSKANRRLKEKELDRLDWDGVEREVDEDGVRKLGRKAARRRDRTVATIPKTKAYGKKNREKEERANELKDR